MRFVNRFGRCSDLRSRIRIRVENKALPEQVTVQGIRAVVVNKVPACIMPITDERHSLRALHRASVDVKEPSVGVDGRGKCPDSLVKAVVVRVLELDELVKSRELGGGFKSVPGRELPSESDHIS